MSVFAIICNTKYAVHERAYLLELLALIEQD